MTYVAIGKKAARRMFNETFKKENNMVIEKIRELATRATSYDDIIGIRKYINSSIKRLDEMYDCRYSRLTYVFAELLANRIISENSLNLINKNKANDIRKIAEFLVTHGLNL